MVLTGISEKNIAYFSHMMKGNYLIADHIYVGAIEDGEAAGAAEFSSEGNMLIVENLYVDEKFRRRGIAEEILGRMIASVRESGVTGVWVSFKSDEAVNSFYEKNGFIITEDCGYYRVSLDEMIDSAMSRKLFSHMKHAEDDKKRIAIPKSLTKAEINQLKNALIGAEQPGAAEMIESLSDLQYSIAVYKTPEKKKVSAFLISVPAGDDLVIKYLANISGDPRDFAFILELFRNMVISKDLRGKTLVFCTADQNIKSIVSKLTGKELIQAGSMMVGYKPIEM